MTLALKNKNKGDESIRARLFERAQREQNAKYSEERRSMWLGRPLGEDSDLYFHKPHHDHDHYTVYN